LAIEHIGADRAERSTSHGFVRLCVLAEEAEKAHAHRNPPSHACEALSWRGRKDRQ